MGQTYSRTSAQQPHLYPTLAPDRHREIKATAETLLSRHRVCRLYPTLALDRHREIKKTAETLLSRHRSACRLQGRTFCPLRLLFSLLPHRAKYRKKHSNSLSSSIPIITAAKKWSFSARHSSVTKTRTRSQQTREQLTPRQP